jgi:hypothetical protein
LPSISGLSHLTRAPGTALAFDKRSLPLNACSRYGPCLDVVDAASRTSNCFTKAYGDYLKGTGSVLRTAHADPAAAAAAIGDADGGADGGADAARRDGGEIESEPESAERRKRKADALVPAMPREKCVRSNFSSARRDAHCCAM